MLLPKDIAGSITGIYKEKIALRESFVAFSARFASDPGTVVLLSGGSLDCSRYHILGTKPWLTFRGRGNRMCITGPEKIVELEADPFELLRELLNMYSQGRPEQGLSGLPEPIAAGLFGYFTYDLKDCLENLVRTSIDDLKLPHICLFAPSIIVVYDKMSEQTHLYIPERTLSGRLTLAEDLKYFQRISRKDASETGPYYGDADGFRSNFTRPEYMEAVEKIRTYITDGHVYQVNLSQRFEMDFEGDSFSLFRDLFKKNPAPFFAYINAGDHQIVSTSPERFIQRNGDQVETRPIKGTRPRGKTDEEDDQLRADLVQSKKDDAELSMIVDLLRNDLGKVCAGGSVRVKDHKKVEAYENVYHLVSVVEGRLDSHHDSVDLIKATFPGGSITGCPKIRTMEIIDELEPNRRHIYTGSIGYIGFHNSFDLSIAIRTATLVNKKMYFSVGGGIVFDSVPSDEFDETLHKGRTLMEVFNGQKTVSKAKGFAWLNGKTIPENKALVSATDPGFQYGFGFFETIRVDRGRPVFFKDHIARFNKTWKHLFKGDLPDLSWDAIISQVIRKNNLESKTAAVKLLASAANDQTPCSHPFLLVTARPYIHRLIGKKERGIRLAVYPEPRLTPLADCKTMNYLYYFLAGKWAKDQGQDEALILNPDGSISETNTANILYVKGKKVVVPESPHVLPGVMQTHVCAMLKEQKYRIEQKKLRPEDMNQTGSIILTNSLMGAVPVHSLEGKKITMSLDLCNRINQQIFYSESLVDPATVSSTEL